MLGLSGVASLESGPEPEDSEANPYSFFMTQLLVVPLSVRPSWTLRVLSPRVQHRA